MGGQAADGTPVRTGRAHRLLPLLGMALFFLALWAIHRELAEVHYDEVVAAVAALPSWRLLAAAGLTVLSLAVLSGYDALALRYVGRTVPLRQALPASAIGYAFSNALGMSVLSGGSVRYRLYSSAGFSVLDVTRVMLFNALTFWLGFGAVAGLAFSTARLDVLPALAVPGRLVQPLGIAFLLAVAGWVAFAALRRKPLRLRGLEFPVPSPGLALAQVGLASLDWTVAASVLYVLLPSDVLGVPFPVFLGLFLLAQIAGLLSTVPGGLGVFEGILLAAFSGTGNADVLAASLAVYRAVYYLAPLVVAAAAMGIRELAERRAAISRIAGRVERWMPALLPDVLALAVFASGIVLLVSGATPTMEDRLEWLKVFVPLSVLEASHFIGSLAGMGLLLLSWGIRRRLDAAWLLVTALLATGIVASLAKGFDYEEATVLLLVLAAFLPSHRHFRRRASLLNERPSAGWIAAVAVVVAGSVWLGFFCYKHVEYEHDLWWQFTMDGDASRFLRASAGVAVAGLLLGLFRLFRPAPPDPPPTDPGILERAGRIAAASPATLSNLALLGDKRFLFDDRDRGMVMYGVSGRAWVSLGDPVGPPEVAEELAWRFHQLAHRHDGWTVFYQVTRASLPVYVDLGLSLMKLGEEARVPLDGFTLDGPQGKPFRHVLGRAEREGFAVEILPAAEVPAHLDDLRPVSDRWLADKNTREKGFSLGSFHEPYLCRFPFALVRKEGRVVAFANLWSGADRHELSVDLMRHLPEAPSYVMDLLFVQLMRWGREQGYRWFNLGMAPLSGYEVREAGPPWARMGAFLYLHGERFYNFQGLRAYKDKFHPVWEPMYLASPGGLALPRVVTAIAALVSRGLLGVVRK